MFGSASTECAWLCLLPIRGLVLSELWIRVGWEEEGEEERMRTVVVM